MLNGQKIVVVMPAYNAARTLRQTYDEVMAHGLVDLVIVVDDASHDETVAIARTLPNVEVEVHPENRGYGANQKTCYRLALAAGADIIIMIHPDYQYTPLLIPAMAALVASGLYPCVLGSRILGGGALRGGMPWWKYVSNRFLTFVENFLIGAKLSEYHTGYRAFSRQLLERLPLQTNSNDFVFDNQILAQIIALGMRHRRGDVPGSLHAGSVIDQFPPKRALRIRLPGNSCAFSFGTLGLGAADRLEMVQGRAISRSPTAAWKPPLLGCSINIRLG